MSKVTVEIAAQHHEVVKRVVEVERQLDRWRALGVTFDDGTRQRIVQQAWAFEPRRPDDIPLVSGGFGCDNPKALVSKMWDAITAPSGFKKARLSMDQAKSFCYASGMKPRSGLRLVHYRHNTYAGFSPEQAFTLAGMDRVQLASIEVFEKLLVDPDSARSWDGRKIFYPNLSGLYAKYDNTWLDVPHLYHEVGGDRKLAMHVRWSREAHRGYCSPTITEC